MLQTTQKLSFGEKAAYGCGDAASNVIWASVGAFIMFYYTDVIHMNAAAIGSIMLISKVINAFVGLAVGWMIDATKSKHGKARVWLLRMAVPFAIATFAVFAVPEMGEKYKLIYIFISYNALLTIYSLINLPYGTLCARMTQDAYQRTLLNIYRQLFAQIVCLIITACTLPMVDLFGNMYSQRTAWSITYAIFGIAAGVLFLICYAGTKERIEEEEKQQVEALSVRKTVAAVVKNKYWVYNVLLNVGINVYYIALSTVNTYYCKAVLHQESMVGIMNSAYIIPCIAGMFFLPSLTKKVGKRYTAMIGWIIILFSYLLLFFGQENMGILIATSVTRGVGYACLIGVSYAMLADSIEYGEWKSGVRIEGPIFSMHALVGTLGSGIVTWLVGVILNMSQYNNELGFADMQPDSAVTAIKILFIVMPMVAAALNIILMGAYQLDKLYPTIMEELEAKKRDRYKNSETGKEA